jgi:hypothetical protein
LLLGADEMLPGSAALLFRTAVRGGGGDGLLFGSGDGVLDREALPGRPGARVEESGAGAEVGKGVVVDAAEVLIGCVAW